MPASPLPSLPPGHTGRLLRVLLGFSLLFLAAHLTFQICLHTMPHLDQLLGPSCESPKGQEGGAWGQQAWGRADGLLSGWRAWGGLGSRTLLGKVSSASGAALPRPGLA